MIFILNICYININMNIQKYIDIKYVYVIFFILVSITNYKILIDIKNERNIVLNKISETLISHSKQQVFVSVFFNPSF